MLTLDTAMIIVNLEAVQSAIMSPDDSRCYMDATSGEIIRVVDEYHSVRDIVD